MVVVIAYNIQPPSNFPADIKIHVGKDETLMSVANNLEKKDVIRSPLLFKIAVITLNGTKSKYRSVTEGVYLFHNPVSVWNVAYRIVKGDQGLQKIRVTIPEGSTARDIAWIMLKSIPDFSAPYFLRIAEPHEGYLFPSTYYFYTDTSADEVLNTLLKTFDKMLKSNSLFDGLSEKKKRDIVIMASIVEEEATASIDRALIAGVLWKRIEIGMPLQVDPPLAYITANTTGYITIKDTQIDSPYNTYKFKGLPKAPISNPGIDALKATLNPTKSPYLFYLSDKKGMMHYAETYEKHLINKYK